MEVRTLPVPILLVHTYRENIDTESVSTDGIATLYANDQTHMFGRKDDVIKKTTGRF